MKRFVTVVLILAAVLMVAGFALLCIGGVHTGWDILQDRADWKAVDKTVTDAFSAVRVEGVATDIRVLPSTDGICRVVGEESDRIRLNVSVDGGVLTVSYQDDRNWYEHIGLWIGQSGKEILLYLPKEQSYRSLELYTVSGDLTVRELSCETLLLETTSGDVRLQGGAVQEALSVTATSGDVALEGVTVQGTLSVTTTSGEQLLSDVSVAGETALHTTSGDIELKRLSSGSITAEATSGDIEGTVLNAFEYSTRTSSGRISVPSSVPGAGRCRITTSSGDIHLQQVK